MEFIEQTGDSVTANPAETVSLTAATPVMPEKPPLARYNVICNALTQVAEVGALRYSWANGQMNKFYTNAEGADKLAALGMHVKTLSPKPPTKFGFPLGEFHFQIEPRTLIKSGGTLLSPEKYANYLETRATTMMMALEKALPLDTIPQNDLNYKLSHPDPASITARERQILKNRELAQLVPALITRGDIRVTEAKGDMPVIIHTNPDGGKLLKKAGAEVSNLGRIGACLLPGLDIEQFNKRVTVESILNPDKFSEDQLLALRNALDDARQLPEEQTKEASKYMRRF